MQALHIRRLQPYSAETDYMGYYLKNAHIECADDSVFLHADTVFTIQESPYYYQDTIRPDKHYKKRYWRISPQFGISNLANSISMTLQAKHFMAFLSVRTRPSIVI
ncbi:MAG: hypothetical protein V8T44_03970 [Odoribacter splanchnicus]